jgi:NADH-quinone oxidoreductase subunit I
VTREYPDVEPELPPRSRGVIALLEENCTVCMLCARECPDWCIYIDSHKETLPATTEGGRERQRNVLDRFEIDFSLCMYCSICVEVCPFDALHWSPEFEYAELDIRDLLHGKERLGQWMPTVPPPPAPWQSWDQVQAAKEALRTYRFLLLRRPEHLNEEEQAQLERLLGLPGGERLRQARRFLEEWYAIPTDEHGTRRTPEEAWERWHCWRQNAAYRQLAPLRRVLERMDGDRARQVLAFLQHPEWEATNNGAERGGRQFRHLQAACFKLRTEAAIDGSLKAWATQTKEARTTRPALVGRSWRCRLTARACCYGRSARHGRKHAPETESSTGPFPTGQPGPTSIAECPGSWPT